ncbi:hypothetical protein PGTUg99_029718 [Puccinia graminis f. sp. tritici]|uniref:Uncharacterized protein n=1 Tax=Puccinia graminis f. sp. tritici TaxID=56615 RepID=A0A5B0RG24_PUCGR|nr:hypothetical protein PGTUg99_029718 [Puccinia graminis f. sp. tritici]
MQAHLSTPDSNPRRRLSSAISKLSLNKMKAFVSSSTIAPNLSSPGTDQSENASDSSLSVSPPPCPILHANSQTMKNYASQRSNKTPFREPALFPTSLNFSQQTIYLFESNEGEDDENLNFYLNDLLLGPSEPATSDQGHKDQTPEKTTKQRSFHLSGRHIKSKKFSLNAFPLTKSVSFQNHGKGLIKRSESTLFRAAKPSALTASSQTASHPVAEPEVLPKKEDLPRKISDPITDYSKFSERTRLLSLPTKLDTAQIKQTMPKEKLPTPLEAIPEQSNVSSPTFSTDSHTALLTPQRFENEAICPRIDMILTSSPFFNNNNSTLSPALNQEPGTPILHSRNTNGCLFQTLTPYTFAAPETPTTCVNSISAHQHQATPHGKFAMSTGSPGIFNLPTPCSQPLRTPVRRQYSLLSPHYLPSPLPPRDSSSHGQASRGPGADMLATLEFLSDLCQKSPEYLEEQDSLHERASIQDSNEL